MTDYARVSELTEASNVVSGDLFEISQLQGDTTYLSKKVSYSNVLSSITTFAAKSLNNLDSVAINTSLISDADNTDDLGSSTYEWKNLYIDGIIYADDIRMDDSQKVQLGTGQDLQIYHDGTNAYVDNLGTQNSDTILRINDATTTRTAIQINGDEGSVTMPRQSYVFARMTADQTIAHNTGTKVAYNTETTDVLGEYASNTFTAKDDGVYVASATVVFGNANNGATYALAIVDGATGTYHWNVMTIGSAEGRRALSITKSVKLSAGQTIDVHVYQNSGGNETLMSSWGNEATVTITKVS